jgi:hypothetical protein
MPHCRGIRHIGPWEYGWKPPERLSPPCPPGVSCVDRSTPDGHIDHVREFHYGQTLNVRRLVSAFEQLAEAIKQRHGRVAKQ